MHRKINDDELLKLLSNFNVKKDKIIAAWGGNSCISKPIYDSRIKKVLDIIGKDKQVYCVGPKTKDGYLRHSKFWCYHEELVPL